MNKRQKRLISFICVFLAVLMAFSLLLSVFSSLAVDESDLARIRERRTQLQTQLSQQAELIQELSRGEALIVDRKAALDGLISLNRQDISLLEEEISAYDEILWYKGLEVEHATQVETTQSELLRERMRAMEESGDESYLTFLFNAESLTDLLSRLGDVTDIMRYDRDLETAYREARSRVETLRDEYELARMEQEGIRSQLSERQEELNAQVESATALISQLADMGEAAQKEYEAIAQAEQQAMQEEQAALAAIAYQQEQARLAALAAAQAQAAAQAAAQAQASGSAGSGNFSGTYAATYGAAASAAGGGFIWPTDSTYITSNYGGRDAPTAGASSYHQAIDIGAAAGSPIYAVADGQVAVATYNNGLGNYVTIAHGGDTSTRYAHMTNYIVQPGEYVTQGQIIGYVGSTGIATGDHLDFAVTANGVSVDPLSYYNSSVLTFDPSA